MHCSWRGISSVAALAITLGFGAGAPDRVEAATRVAAGCGQTDIETAISAASDGDTIIVPAGTCTWTSQILVDDDKGLVIQGHSESRYDLFGYGVTQVN